MQTNQRLLDVLANKAVDRPPFWFMRQAGRYLPEYQEVRAQAGDFLSLCYSPELAAEVTLQPIRRYAPDAAILFADILVVPDALGQKVEYAEGHGPQLERIEDDAGVAGLDIARLHDHLSPVYETVGRLSKALPDDVTLIGFAGAPWTVACYMVEGQGSKEFERPRLWALREPEGFSKLIDLLVDATSQYLGAQIDAGAQVVQIFDSWAGVLSPSAFERWCIEPTRRIVEALHAAHPGVPIIGFPRGSGAKCKTYFERTGVDAVSLDTGMSPHWAAEVLQPMGAVQGNLDPLALVSGSPVLEEEARSILEALGKGPFIFNLGHGIVPQTPPEHVGILADFVRNWPKPA